MIGIISYKINLLRSDVENHILISTFGDEYTKYNKLIFICKLATDPDSFRDKVQQAGYSYCSIITWGGIELVHCVSTLLSLVVSVFSTGNWKLLVMVLILDFVTYRLFIRKLRQKLDDQRKVKQENKKEFNDRIKLVSEQFRNRERTVQEMKTIEYLNLMCNSTYVKIWSTIMCTANIANKIPLVFLFYQTNSLQEFLVLNTIVSQFNNSVSSLMNFFNQYQRAEDEHDTLQSFWDGKEFEDELETMDLPNELVITQVAIPTGKNNDLLVTLEDGQKNLVIKMGSKILITGESGHGKTTFVDALIGKRKGIKLANGETRNYSRHYVEFYQAIKERLPTNTTTVRQLFDDEINDRLILECCEIACVDDWVNSLVPSCDSTLFHPTLDTKISESISGGQKTRLAMATRIYKMIKHNHQILIIDEGEQGSDSKVAYKMIGNILRRFPDRTIIVISHLELIEFKEKWDMYLKVVDRVISKYVPDISEVFGIVSRYKYDDVV